MGVRAVFKLIVRLLLVAGMFAFWPAKAWAQTQNQSQDDGDWFLEAIQAPQNIPLELVKRALVIAIVDDSFRISHQDLRAFIWRNGREIPANDIDDDGDNYVDDVHGWDVSDGDGTVAPPEDRLENFYHGTHLAGVVTQILRRAYGDGAAERVKIMPVKSLADRATLTYLEDGYKGIEYAIRAGADIILTAWGVGHISEEESRILREAERKGVLIVASAGNFSQANEQYPAAHEPVLAVAALDRQNKKTDLSNFGPFVDLSAPGIDIGSASSKSDREYETRQGTSQAAAMVAAAASIVRLQHPSYSWQDVTACLKQSAEPIDAVNPRFTAALGAGKLDLAAAIDCDQFDNNGTQPVVLVNPQGYLRFDGRRGRTASWTVAPHGEFKGLRFRPRPTDNELAEGTLEFHTGVSADAPLVASYPLAELPESVYVAGAAAHVVFKGVGAGKPLNRLLEYRAEPIDFTRLYCSDTKHLDAEGKIDDGSGPNDYSYNSSCKWLITAPEGKVINIKFSEFDTPIPDKIYFFDGAGTQENIMAVFSGTVIPPEFTTWHNEVLVWFVTDAKIQGKGWRADYRFVER